MTVFKADYNNPKVLLEKLQLSENPDSDKELQQWRNMSDRNEKDYQSARKLVEMNRRLAEMKRFDANSALLDVKNRIEKTSKHTKVISWFQRIAAVLIIPLLVYTIFQKTNLEHSHSPILWKTISNNHMTVTSFLLSDNSEVWLNVGTTIKIPDHFDSEQRSVELVEGEAFFNIQKDRSRSFIVKGKDVHIKVLGTAFNVSCYKDDHQVKVALAEGSIQLLTAEGNALSKLAPRELAILDKEDKRLLIKSNIEVDKFINWRSGAVSFNDDNFETFVRKLERVFNVEIRYQSRDWENFQLNACFKNESLEQMLNLLSISEGLKYEILPRQKLADGTITKKKIRIYK